MDNDGYFEGLDGDPLPAEETPSRVRVLALIPPRTEEIHP